MFELIVEEWLRIARITKKGLDKVSVLKWKVI